MKTASVLALVFMGLALVASQGPPQLYVTFLLGSLCPDSIRYIQNQVNPIYNHFREYVNFEFVPFGKAYSTRQPNGTYAFTCQHGPQDCSNSRMMLCALSALWYYPEREMEYVACQMAFGADLTGQQCAERVGLNYEALRRCYNGPAGDMYQLDAEGITNAIQNPLEWVPTTQVGYFFDQEISRRAEFNLQEVLCEALDNRPPICRDRLQVGVYYGSLCPDSINFIQNQVRRAFFDLGSHAEFTFVPFGKASSSRDANGVLTFTCQHGPRDCSNTRIQLCAIDHLQGQERRIMDFITCQMAPNAEPTGAECSDIANMDFSIITDCYNSELGDTLMLEAEAATNRVQNPLNWVPTITYQGVFDTQVSIRSELDLARVICEQTGNQAQICRNKRLSVQIMYGSLCPDSISYIQNQVVPMYNQLSNYATFQFIPFGKAQSSVSESGEVTFTCQHGDVDCSVSRIQLCAIQYLAGDSRRIMDFVACQMAPGADVTGETCATQVGIPFYEITFCYSNGEGQRLQLTAERQTNFMQNPLEWVPTTTYNWVFNAQNSARSELDLGRVICEQTENRAPYCRDRRASVQILYGSICPDSINFMQNQLAPVFNRFRSYVHFTFIPFGKANSSVLPSGEIEFTCQHGARDCSSSRIQLCAINYLGDDETAIKTFVTCQTNFFAEPTGADCAALVNMPFEAITECYNSNLGTALQLAAERQTNLVQNPLEWVPTTTFNWIFNPEDAVRSELDLSRVICEQIDNAAPVCRRRLSIQMFLGSLCPDSINFIQNQVAPIFNSLRNYAEFNFIPFGKAQSSVSPSGEITFTCQHGDVDCAVSRIQLCAIDYLGDDEVKIMNYISCQMAFGADVTGETCANQVGIPFEYITDCVTHEEGVNLQLAAERQTNLIQNPLEWVPTTTYNWRLDTQLSTRSELDLSRVICEQIDNQAPFCRRRASVQVFLGSLCPDSINFIQHQVAPLFSQVRNAVQFQFIPFGRAQSIVSSNGEIEFLCQHGPEDCAVSRIQLCAINFLGSEEQRIMNFLACQMAPNADLTGETCASQVNIPFSVITECVNSNLGTSLQLSAERQTNLIQNPLEWVPTTTFNWVFDVEVSSRAEADLIRTLCEQINNDAAVCRRRLPVQLFYGSLNSDSVNFIQNQVAPIFNELNAYAQFTFVPFGRSSSTNLGGGNVAFTCADGPRDCSVSRIQLCAINHLGNQEARIMSFITCQMAPNADSTGETCAESTGIPFEVISECYNSQLGTYLQLNAERQTNLVQDPLEWVPTTTINWSYDPMNSARSELDLARVICEHIENEAPICQRRLSVQVLLGSLCPDSISFIQNQVVPLFAEINEYAQFTFVPFGKAESHINSEGEIYFECQHGPEDCSLSRIQLCAIDYLGTNETAIMNFIGCQMAPNADRTGATCAALVDIPFEVLTDCYNDGHGQSLQLIAERENFLIQYPLQWVPTTVYNWAFDASDVARSELDLARVICEQINNAAPICQRRLSVSVLYGALCPDSVNLIQNQIAPIFEEVSEYVEFTFVPFGKAQSEILDSGDIGFTCQHDYEDCSHGRIQLCAINHLGDDEARIMEFIACQMTHSPDITGATCAAQLNIPHSVLTECYNSQLGLSLQLAAERTTNLVQNPLEWVPTTVINWNFNNQNSDRAQLDLISVICDQIYNDAPFCQRRVSVQFFYGSLCPDSINYIQSQVVPLFNQINQYAQFQFIPFGKAESSVSENGEITFTCQHGPEDCDVSRVQLCAINYLGDDEQRIMNFVSCQMAFGSDRTGATCAAEVNIPFEVITECINSGLGQSLQLTAERQTNLVQSPLEWVPTTTFNWIYDAETSPRTELDLARVVCEHINDEAPVCQRKLTVQLFLGALCPDSMKFVQDQVAPIFEELSEYAEFTFIPFGKAYSSVDENGTISFTCQDGASECSVTRRQLCAIDILGDDEARIMEFMTCQMSPDAGLSVEACATRVNIPFEDLMACYQSDLGTSLMLAAERRTNLIQNPLEWVPTTTYNWFFDPEYSSRSEVDLGRVICEQIGNIAPMCTARVSVQFFLGSLCPDSINFIQNQVAPLFEEISDYAEFTFVPFGKAESVVLEDGSVAFTCQHGPDDCSVSRIQLCAINYLDEDEARIMEFVSCQMAQGADITGETCANQVNIPFSAITECYESELGDTLQLYAERQTNLMQDPLEWVPTTTYNWHFYNYMSVRSELDLARVICEQIDNRAPICRRRVSFEFFYGSLCPDSIGFIQNQLMPIFHDAHEFVELTFVPFGKAYTTVLENGQIMVSCQHGEDDCTLSRIQLCAIEYLGDDEETIANYVGCQMSWNADVTGRECANRFNIPFDQINSCSHSAHGFGLQLAAERRTNLIQNPLEWVPTTTINWWFDAGYSTRSELDLARVICEHTDFQPSFCTNRFSVQLFLGSLCPDSIRFVQNQVVPLFTEVAEYVDFTFVPFGKAESLLLEGGEIGFTCQHGDQDCSVSRVQLCAIYYLGEDTERIFEFVSCQMAFDSDRTGQTCAEQVDLPFNVITECYNSTLGTVLQLNAERYTNLMQNPLEWVPTTTYNWAFNAERSSRSEQDLGRVICEQIDYWNAENNAIICAPRTPIAVIFGTLCPDSITFIQEQLMPIYHAIKNFVDITFLPNSRTATNEDGEVEFTCIHGEEDCRIGRLMACGIDYLGSNRDRVMNYVACQMNYGSDRTGETCATQNGIPFERITDCFYTDAGVQLQLEASQAATSLVNPVPWVPTIVYNNEYNTELNERSELEFRTILCEVTQNRIPTCQRGS